MNWQLVGVECATKSGKFLHEMQKDNVLKRAGLMPMLCAETSESRMAIRPADRRAQQGSDE